MVKMLSDLPFIYTTSGEVEKDVYGSMTSHVSFGDIKEIYRYENGKIGIYYDFFGQMKLIALNKNDAFEFEKWYEETFNRLEKKNVRKAKKNN